MAAGLSAANANAGLAAIAGANAAYAQLHTGDPGTAGTSNVSSVTTRQAVTWPSSATSSVIAASNTPQWTSWAGTPGEVVTYISLWSAASGGTFGASMQLGSSVTMGTGDSLTLTQIQFSMTGALAS